MHSPSRNDAARPSSCTNQYRRPALMPSSKQKASGSKHGWTKLQGFPSQQRPPYRLRPSAARDHCARSTNSASSPTAQRDRVSTRVTHTLT
jgi:hypothetical protein